MLYIKRMNKPTMFLTRELLIIVAFFCSFVCFGDREVLVVAFLAVSMVEQIRFISVRYGLTIVNAPGAMFMMTT